MRLGQARWLAFFFAAASLAPACRYSVDPNSGLFHCATDSDCGDGWHCFDACKASGFSAYCSQNGSCDPCPSFSDDPQNCGSCGKACASGQGCIDGVCLSVLAPDAGADAGIDAGVDAGSDAGMDAGTDAGVDAGLDAGAVDAGADAGLDAGADAGSPLDAGQADAGSDAGSADAGNADAGPDAGP